VLPYILSTLEMPAKIRIADRRPDSELENQERDGDQKQAVAREELTARPGACGNATIGRAD